MKAMTIDSRNGHGELTARITKAPSGEPDPRAPIELLAVPMRDCADGWKVRVRGRRADRDEDELVLYGLTASEAVRAAVEAWLGGEGAHPTQLLERVLALRERRGASSGGEELEGEGDAQWCAVCSAYGQRTRATGRERDLVAAADGSSPRRAGTPIWTCKACGEELRQYPNPEPTVATTEEP